MSESPLASDIPEAKPGFEGPEKVLEIDFVPGQGPVRGLREITRAQWDHILTQARCTILSTLSNDKIDSYVLSESSLFVYPLKLILKTCGTTTLLMCLPALTEVTKALGMSIEWMAYTRKDFQFPHNQKFPHRDPNEEAHYLKRFFPEGSAFIMGPVTGDHWFVFVADYVDRPTTECVDRTLDMMMFGIDEEVARLFVKDTDRFPKDSDVTRASGIDTLLPGSMIQEFCFEPCGYSMNGLLYDAYWTIHITPESHCSYASFETNIRMTNYASLIKSVLAIFRPKRFTMTLFADEHGLRQMKDTPFQQLLPVPVVESTARALMGPCVMMADGNISHGSVIVGGKPVVPSIAEETQLQQAQLLHPVLPPESAVNSSLLESGGGANGDFPAPVIPSPNAASNVSDDPSSVAASGGSAAITAPATYRPLIKLPSFSTVPMAEFVGRKLVLSYVITAKCNTEFMGYCCFLGNFKLVVSTIGTGTRGNLTSIPDAAKAQLSMPRAKYAMAEQAEQLSNRARTESF